MIGLRVVGAVPPQAKMGPIMDKITELLAKLGDNLPQGLAKLLSNIKSQEDVVNALKELEALQKKMCGWLENASNQNNNDGKGDGKSDGTNSNDDNKNENKDNKVTIDGDKATFKSAFDNFQKNQDQDPLLDADGTDGKSSNGSKSGSEIGSNGGQGNKSGNSSGDSLKICPK